MPRLRLPSLPRFGAPSEPIPPKARDKKRSPAASLSDVPIRLRVSPTAVVLPPPTRARADAKQFSFAAFAQALRDASDPDTTVEVEAFCADPVKVANPGVHQPSAIAPPTGQEMEDLASIRRAAGAPLPVPPEPVLAPAEASRSQSQTASPRTADKTRQPPEHTHAVFDRMALATTFDVGTISLERRFRDLDAELDREQRVASSRAKTARAMTNKGATAAAVPSLALDARVVDDGTLGEDLSRLRAACTPTLPLSLTVADIALAPAHGGQSIDVGALAPGDIIVSTVTGSPVSAAIRLATHAPVSHSLLYLGHSQVAEAIGTGVVIRSIHDAVAESELAVAFRVPELSAEQAAEIVRFARAQEGKSYNYFGIVRQALFRLDEAIYCRGKSGDERDRCRNWLGRVLLGPGNSDTYYCSQLVLDAYHHAGVPLTQTPAVWSAPGDVAELALSRPWAYVGHLKAPIPG